MNFEQQVHIDTMLDITGINLDFTLYVIKAEAGFAIISLADNNGIITGSESQEFNFYTSTKNCIDNSIKQGDLFTMNDTLYEYSFKVYNDPIPYMDGWSRFPAAYLNKVEL